MKGMVIDGDTFEGDFRPQYVTQHKLTKNYALCVAFAVL